MLSISMQTGAVPCCECDSVWGLLLGVVFLHRSFAILGLGLFHFQLLAFSTIC
jgi:hypothetical protein